MINKQEWLKFIEDRDKEDIIDCIFDFEISRYEMYQLIIENLKSQENDNKTK